MREGLGQNGIKFIEKHFFFHTSNKTNYWKPEREKI
jgi:hypothetical protein